MARLPEIWRANRPSLFDRNLFMEDFFNEFFDLFHRGQPAVEGNFMSPQMDIDETDDAYLVSMDMPGVPKENINIDLNGNILTVTGERRSRFQEGSQEQGSERSYVKFQRSFTLPSTVDVNKVEANCENGLLEIYLPKSEEARPKKIEISSGKGGFKDRILGQKQQGQPDEQQQEARH